jgi:hypothetical protein
MSYGLVLNVTLANVASAHEIWIYENPTSCSALEYQTNAAATFQKLYPGFNSVTLSASRKYFFRWLFNTAGPTYQYWISSQVLRINIRATNNYCPLITSDPRLYSAPYNCTFV